MLAHFPVAVLALFLALSPLTLVDGEDNTNELGDEPNGPYDPFADYIPDIYDTMLTKVSFKEFELQNAN